MLELYSSAKRHTYPSVTRLFWITAWAVIPTVVGVKWPILNYLTWSMCQSTFLTGEGKRGEDPFDPRAVGHVHGVERPQSCCLVWRWLITASWHLSGFSPEEMCSACSASALLQEPALRGWVGWGEAAGDEWRQVDSCMDRRETMNAVWCSIGGIYAPTAAGTESLVYLATQRSRRDEISKWGTCLKMRGIPQGWAKGYWV